MKSLYLLTEQLKVALLQAEDTTAGGAADEPTPSQVRDAGKERTQGIPKGARGVPSGRSGQKMESFDALLARSTRYLQQQRQG